MAKLARIDVAFLEAFEQEASPARGQEKEKKGQKKKDKGVGHFLF